MSDADVIQVMSIITGLEGVMTEILQTHVDLIKFDSTMNDTSKNNIAGMMVNPGEIGIQEFDCDKTPDGDQCGVPTNTVITFPES